MATYMEPPVKNAFPVVENAKNIVFSFPWLNEALSIPLCLANVSILLHVTEHVEEEKDF
jgi:hypothetical protein